MIRRRYKGRHRVTRYSITVFDIKTALINEQLAAQKPWTLADLREFRAVEWNPYRKSVDA